MYASFLKIRAPCIWSFLLCRGRDVVSIEVKSGRIKGNLPGTEVFSRAYRVKRKLLVGVQGIPLADFLMTPPEEWLG